MSSMKDILINFRKDLTTTFRAQKNILDVTERYLLQLEDAESGGGAGGINYSTTEQDTGLKWVDGKEIYQITLDIDSASSGDNSINHGISNVAHIVNAYGIMFTKSGVSIPVPNGDPQSQWILKIYNCGATSFGLTVGSGLVSDLSHIYVTLQYTKSA